MKIYVVYELQFGEYDEAVGAAFLAGFSNENDAWSHVAEMSADTVRGWGWVRSPASINLAYEQWAENYHVGEVEILG